MRTLQYVLIFTVLMLATHVGIGQPFTPKQFSSQDNMRGWSWDGNTASYIATLNGKSYLFVRSFDGETYGSVDTEIQFSGSDPIRGWNWDGTTASYLGYLGGKTTLYVRSFDGKKLGTEIKQIEMSSSDNFLSWYWDGETAIYHAKLPGTQTIICFKRPFNGNSFYGLVEREELEGHASEAIRGFTLVNGMMPSFGVFDQSVTTVYPGPPPPQVRPEDRDEATFVLQPWGYTIVVPPAAMADLNNAEVNGFEVAGEFIGLFSLIPSPIAPIFDIIALYVSNLLPIMNEVDQGKGVYLSATWVLLKIPIPTTIVD